MKVPLEHGAIRCVYQAWHSSSVTGHCKSASSINYSTEHPSFSEEGQPQPLSSFNHCTALPATSCLHSQKYVLKDPDHSPGLAIGQVFLTSVFLTVTTNKWHVECCGLTQGRFWKANCVGDLEITPKGVFAYWEFQRNG